MPDPAHVQLDLQVEKRQGEDYVEGGGRVKMVMGHQAMISLLFHDTDTGNTSG